jgi:hypothetical protein
MRLSSILLLALPFLSAVEFWSHKHFRTVAPREADWQALEPAIASMYRTADLVHIVPAWADPLLRQTLGESRMPLSVLGRADDDTLPRVIAVSFDGASDSAFAAWPERERHQVGPFQIRILDNPKLEVARMRLIDRVAPTTLQVFEGPPGDPHTCSFTKSAAVSAGGLGGNPTLAARRFACPSGEPHVVAVTTIDDERFAPRRCIWAHPSAIGPMTLLFRDVWLGQKLVGHAGLPWLISRDGVGTPIHLDVRFEGIHVGSVVVEDTEGWKRFEWPTIAEQDRRGDLEVVISTAEPQNRRLCFTLESR